jgi:NADP-dependent 3-hydroxy acid dehydrogenase YdfG
LSLFANDVEKAITHSFAQPPRVLVQEILVGPEKQTAP